MPVNSEPARNMSVVGRSVFSLEIVTPGKVFFSGDVEMVIFKTPQGEMGVLKDHMPLVVISSAGPFRFLKDGKWHEAVIAEGFAEIRRNRAVILTRDAQWKSKM